MPDNPRSHDPRWQRGCLLACEGILRSQFGRRSTNAVNRALEQLRGVATLDDDITGDENVPGRPSRLPLLGERAGVRANVASDSLFTEVEAAAGTSLPQTVPMDSPEPAGESQPSSDLRAKVIPFPLWARWVAAAACFLLLALAGAWFQLRPDNSLFLVKSVAPESAAVVERAGRQFPLTSGLRFQVGDVIRTGTESKLVVADEKEPTEIALKGDTELKLGARKKGKRFELARGTIAATVAPQRWWRPMVIMTPNAQARVLGTRFTLTAETNSTRLDVAQGRVRLTRTRDLVAVAVSAGHYAIVAEAVELAPLLATGRILREYWLNVPGVWVDNLVAHTNYPNRPSVREFVSSISTPKGWGTNYGALFRGYVHPPLTGPYQFWIEGEDDAYFSLSPNDDPKNAVLISVKGRGSSPVNLLAGRRYYLEAVHKAGASGVTKNMDGLISTDSYIDLTWLKPGGQRELLRGEFLSPFKLKK